jgi:ATP synthase protein I
MTQNVGGETPEDPGDRFARLTRDLEARKQAGTAGSASSGPLAGPAGVGSAMSLGFRVMSEFVAAVAVGAVIGWAADRWLGTSPFLLILFIALGTAAGFWTVYRLATNTSGVPGKR